MTLARRSLPAIRDAEIGCPRPSSYMSTWKPSSA